MKVLDPTDKKFVPCNKYLAPSLNLNPEAPAFTLAKVSVSNLNPEAPAINLNPEATTSNLTPEAEEFRPKQENSLIIDYMQWATDGMGNSGMILDDVRRELREFIATTLDEVLEDFMSLNNELLSPTTLVCRKSFIVTWILSKQTVTGITCIVLKRIIYESEYFALDRSVVLNIVV